MASDILKAREGGYQYKAVTGTQNEYELTKRVIGNVALTNYPPRTMENAELAQLNSMAESTPDNYVKVDIRPDHPGGDYAIFGAIRLRSLNEILRFVAVGIEKKIEYAVDMDPRTARIGENVLHVLRNPAKTLEIVISRCPPPYCETLIICYRGAYYYVANTVWDRKAFNILYLLFHISTEHDNPRGFPITISK